MHGGLPIEKGPKTFENATSVRAAQHAFAGAFGMRHEPHDVAFLIHNTRNIVSRAIRVGVRGDPAFAIAVTEEHLAARFEIGEHVIGRNKISLAMGDRNADRFPKGTIVGKPRIVALDMEVHFPAGEGEGFVPNEDARQKPAFAEHLEAIANAEDGTAFVRITDHTLHHRRKASDGAGTKVIAIGKSSGKYYKIDVLADRFVLVPDERGIFLAQDVLHGMQGIVIAVRAGKNNDARPHAAVVLPCTAGRCEFSNGIISVTENVSMIGLARSFSLALSAIARAASGAAASTVRRINFPTRVFSTS